MIIEPIDSGLIEKRYAVTARAHWLEIAAMDRNVAGGPRNRSIKKGMIFCGGRKCFPNFF
jgi:hypothetical protein